MGQKASRRAIEENNVITTGVKVDDFLQSIGCELDKMMSKRRHFNKGLWRRLGGTVILNFARPPFNDLALADISRKSTQIQEPYKLNDIRRIFALKHGHDVALLVHIFDQSTGEFSPTVHSSQNTIPVDPNDMPDWLRREHGMRHQSGYCMSALTNAWVVIVSEEYGRLCIFRNTGEAAPTRLEFAALHGSITLAEHYISTVCDVSICTPEKLAKPELTDWFLFFYVEAVDQLSLSAKYVRHEGVIELPNDPSWIMEPEALEKFLWNFEWVANDAVGDYGAGVEVDHERRLVELMVDLTGRFPSTSTEEMKKLVEFALLQARDFKFECAEDVFMKELEGTSTDGNGSNAMDTSSEEEIGVDTDEDVASTPKRRKIEEAAGLTETEVLGDDDVSSSSDPSGRVSPMETEELSEPETSTHCNSAGRSPLGTTNTGASARPTIRWTGIRQPTFREISDTPHTFREEGEALLKQIAMDEECAFYLLQRGATNYGGFVLRLSENVFSIETTFMSRRFLENGYFHNLLAKFFRQPIFDRSKALKWLPGLPFSCEPIIVDTTVQKFIDKYERRD
ncbi:hypothetical protein AAVH_27741 [Aphelenchoides avenae]|nr:hypothetical protein AAVH_27741 [Aphelenchus avenae]